jgi:hypothetical protein
MCRRLHSRRRPVPQIQPGDFDIPVIGQLPPTQFALGDPFKVRALEVVGFEATLGGWTLGQKALENTPREPDNALVLADADTELDSLPLGIPAGILGEGKEHGAASAPA